MIDRKIAPMPEAVRAFVQSEIRRLGGKGAGDYWQVPLIILALGAYAYFDVGSRHPGSKVGGGDTGMSIAIVVLLVVIVGFVGLGYFLYEHSRRPPSLKIMREELKAGNVEMITGACTGAVLIDEVPPAVFLDIGDDQILYLTGSWIDAPTREEDGKLTVEVASSAEMAFPNTEFTAMLLPVSKKLYAVECTGQGFAPREILERGALGADLPQNGSVFRGKLDQLATHPWLV